MEIHSTTPDPDREMEMVMRVGHLDDDQDYLDALYWLSRPVEERLAEVERLRRMEHGEDYEITQRLDRSALVLERRPM